MLRAAVDGEEVGCPPLGIAKPPSATDEVLVFCDRVRLLPGMFQAGDDDRGRGRVDAHGKRCRRDDHAERARGFPKLLLDDTSLVSIEVRVVEADAMGERVPEIA